MNGNIMIVDDSPIERKIIRQILEKKLDNVMLYEAENGLDITEKIMQHNIQVCILDIIMPVKNGFQVLREIKEHPAAMDIPVIVCTGIDDGQAVERALSLGAYDYFPKPLSEEAMKISLPCKVRNALELMKRKEEIIYLNYHDKLTGFYNRRFCEEEMRRIDTERNLPISLIFGDVNGLKLTNDAFGHHAGDRLLTKIAGIIRSECRKGELIARMGGDEFLIVLPRTKAEDAEKLINRIREKCAKGKEDPIKPSIAMGYAVKELAGQDLKAVYRAAEDKMYNNKLMESKNVRNSIIASLRESLLNGAFESHSDRLIEYSEGLGTMLGLSADQKDNLRMLSLLHDIGITGIPNELLTKSGDLSPEERRNMEKHCEIGYRIAGASPDLAHIANDILSHHEQWSGGGYPQGLSGDSIPLNARIIAVLDAYDAMLHGSFDQRPVSRSEAVEFIESQAGKRFDPQIAAAFLKMLSERDEQ